ECGFLLCRPYLLHWLCCETDFRHVSSCRPRAHSWVACKSDARDSSIPPIVTRLLAAQAAESRRRRGKQSGPAYCFAPRGGKAAAASGGHWCVHRNRFRPENRTRGSSGPTFSGQSRKRCCNCRDLHTTISLASSSRDLLSPSKAISVSLAG